jgi:hypothetical protein
LALFDSILVGQKAYKEIEANDSLGAKALVLYGGRTEPIGPKPKQLLAGLTGISRPT